MHQIGLRKFVCQHQKSRFKLSPSNFQFGNRVRTQKKEFFDRKVSITWRDQRSTRDPIHSIDVFLQIMAHNGPF